MTPPPKKKPIKIIEHSKKFKSKPEQIQESITPPPEPHHQVVDNISYYIAKNAAERLKEKKGD